MRLGRWGIAAVAVVSALGSVVIVEAPAGSASRKKDRSYEARDTDSSQGPARFVAEIGGRIVVVSAETGRAERYLTDVKPGGGAWRPAVSPDGRVVWFSRSDGDCAAHLASAPVTGGKEEKVPGSGEAGPETVPLPRPGLAQLAYARLDCEKPSSALIVGDLDGLEGHGQSGLVPMAWSRDGDLLLARKATGHEELRLLRINKAGGIVGNQALAPTDSVGDCRLEVVGFSPDDNKGYVALRRCGPSGDRGRRSLVLLDRDGNLRKTVLRLSRGQDFSGQPVFDRIGRSLLYFTVPPGADDNKDETAVSLWLWRDGQSRRLERQTGYRHPAWLP